MKLKRWKVKKALREYPLIGVRLKHIHKDIAIRQKELDLITPAITSYGEMGDNSSPQDSPIEKIMDRREKAKGRIDLLSMEAERLTWEKEKIDEALKTLPAEERELITRIYINGESPVSVACDVGFCGTSLTKHTGKALDAIAFILFGI